MPNSFGKADGSAPVVREPEEAEFRVTTGGDLVLLVPPTYDGGDPAVDAILKYADMNMDRDTALRRALASGIWE